MEKRPQERNSAPVFAWILIVIGIVWLLRKLGFYFGVPNFHDIFFPFGNIFHGLTAFIFSWPMILIFVGLILMAGKRSSGLVLVVIGGVFLVPKLFFINGISLTLFFPLLLVGLGIAMIARIL